MKVAKHVLQSLKLDISFYSEHQAPALYTRISNLASERIYSIINKVCDEQLADRRIFARIDKLELDIGQMSDSELATQLPERLYGSLEKALREQLSLSYNPRESDGLQVAGEFPRAIDRTDYSNLVLQKSKKHHHTELLFEFFNKGRLPWWAEEVTGRQLELIFLDQLKNSPQEIITRIYQSDNCSNIIQRIVFRFSDSTLTSLAKAIAETSRYARDVLEYSSSTKEALRASPYHVRIDEKRWWKMLLDVLGASQSKSGDDYRRAVQFIIENTALENDLNPATKDYFKQKGEIIGSTLLELIIKTGQKQTQEVQLFIRELFWLKMKDPALYEKAYSFSLSQLSSLEKSSDFGRYAYEVVNFIRKELATNQPTVVRLKGLFPEPGAGPQISEPNIGLAGSEVGAPTEVCYIENAGLVLLNPFFSTYFQRLGLMKGGQFISRFEAAKAVHLLQFLADGRQRHDEPLLVLNKLLCGMDIAEPIAIDCQLNEDDQRISMELLNAVKDNWPPLKNSSIAALRQEFLQRSGQLKHYNNQWVLRVEHNGRSDYLLEKLPWSFAMIKNSWMPEILNVEWI